MKTEELIETAFAQLSRSYAPYSHFKVGAALETVNGRVYTGCNVENASFGAGNCAERTAVFKAVSEGERQWKRIAVVGGKDGQVTEYCPPCGICRQVLREFCGPDFQIILAKSRTEYQIYSLLELFPQSFGPDQLEE